MNIEAAQFGVVMENLQKHARDGLVDPFYGTLSNQGRLLLERIIKFTPAKAEDQQRAAIRGDLLKVFQLRKAEYVAALVRVAGNQPYRGWITPRVGFGSVWIETSGTVRNVAEMMVIHRRYYTRRGRTRKVPLRYVVAPEVFAEYLKFLYLAVGKAKAGWLPAATRLFTPGLPQWVLRHAPGKGIFHDGRQDPRPYIEAINTTPWALHRDEGERIVRGAVETRVRDMERYLGVQMELALKKTGFTAA